MPVGEEDCASLRRSYNEEDDADLLEISQSVPWTYQTVLRHVNGECNHEVEVPARVVGKRAHISEDLCREFRKRYRENRELTLSKLEPLAEDYEASAGSIQRHIRFRCAHDPESTLLDQVGGWQDLVTEEGTLDHIDEAPGPEESAAVAAGKP